MSEPTNISKRIETLKRLAAEYFDMEYGAPIEHPCELLRIFDIRSSKYGKHPRKGSRVYISRKSLKHFVEMRKVELEKRHSEEEILDRIMFALDHLQETVINYEQYEEDRTRVPPSHLFTKNYLSNGIPLIRVLLDEKDSDTEICSIHFRTP